MRTKIRILILEDDADDAELMESQLRAAGLGLSIVRVKDRSGFEGSIESFEPDLIISDYSLPGFSGVDALGIAALKKPDIPFIMVSGAIGEESAVDLIRLGAKDFILKDRLSKLAPAAVRALREFEEIRKRKAADRALHESELRYKRLFEEKQLLLKEVQHRVKNNMSIMISLLNLHADELSDNPSAVSALRDAMSRMKSMEVLYDLLYRLDNSGEASLRAYLTPLLDKIIDLFPDGKRITVERRMDEMVLEARVLLPLGIILNELITNALKYEFAADASGSLRVSVTKSGDKAILIVNSDGPNKVDKSALADSQGFGLRLVEILAKQLGGRFKIEFDAGVTCIVEFDPRPLKPQFLD